MEKQIEEMADVYIMLEQMRMIFDIQNLAINDVVDKKITRLESKLKSIESEG